MSHTTLAQALGQIPSGLFVLTSVHKQHETGMLASWVMQAGFEPPMVSVAVQRDRPVANWLKAGAPIVLNILAEDDRVLLKHFAKGFAPDEPAFEGLSIERSSHGVPILLDAAGHLECVPKESVDSGDHRIFLAEVVSGHLQDHKKPAIHLRKNGLRY